MGYHSGGVVPGLGSIIREGGIAGLGGEGKEGRKYSDDNIRVEMILSRSGVVVGLSCGQLYAILYYYIPLNGNVCYLSL